MGSKSWEEQQMGLNRGESFAGVRVREVPGDLKIWALLG